MELSTKDNRRHSKPVFKEREKIVNYRNLLRSIDDLKKKQVLKSIEYKFYEKRKEKRILKLI